MFVTLGGKYLHAMHMIKQALKVWTAFRTVQSEGILFPSAESRTEFYFYSTRDGISCDECITFPGCVNGNCTTANECNCDAGWNGVFCDTRKLP